MAPRRASSALRMSSVLRSPGSMLRPLSSARAMPISTAPKIIARNNTAVAAGNGDRATAMSVHARGRAAATVGGNRRLEQLLDIHRIEDVGAIAKIAVHFDLAAFRDHPAGFAFAPSLQHAGTPLARTPPPKIPPPSPA